MEAVAQRTINLRGFMETGEKVWILTE